MRVTPAIYPPFIVRNLEANWGYVVLLAVCWTLTHSTPPPEIDLNAELLHRIELARAATDHCTRSGYWISRVIGNGNVESKTLLDREMKRYRLVTTP